MSSGVEVQGMFCAISLVRDASELSAVFSIAAAAVPPLRAVKAETHRRWRGRVIPLGVRVGKGVEGRRREATEE